MAFAVDEDPVRALGSRSAYPALGVTVRAARQSLTILTPLPSEDPVECAGELGIAIPDEETEGADPVCEVLCRSKLVATSDLWVRRATDAAL